MNIYFVSPPMKKEITILLFLFYSYLSRVFLLFGKEFLLLFFTDKEALKMSRVAKWYKLGKNIIYLLYNDNRRIP